MLVGAMSLPGLQSAASAGLRSASDLPGAGSTPAQPGHTRCFTTVATDRVHSWRQTGQCHLTRRALLADTSSGLTAFSGCQSFTTSGWDSTSGTFGRRAHRGHSFRRRRSVREPTGLHHWFPQARHTHHARYTLPGRTSSGLRSFLVGCHSAARFGNRSATERPGAATRPEQAGAAPDTQRSTGFPPARLIPTPPW